MANRFQIGSNQCPKRPPYSPYLEWAIATKFRYCRRGKWLPLLVRFDSKALITRHRQVSGNKITITPLNLFRQLNWLGEKWRDKVRIAQPFFQLPAALERSSEVDFGVILFPLEPQLDVLSGVLADPGWLDTIVEAIPGPPIGNESMTWTYRKPEACWRRLLRFLLVPARRVLMAVLDEGIAYAHERFRDGNKSRIEYLWRQDRGDDLTAAEIEAGLAMVTSNGRTDEDLLYEGFGDIDFSADGFKALARRRSHGTHVLDLAAGARSDNAPKNRPIVAVELPSEAVGDPSGTPLYAHILMGLIYVLVRAEDLRLCRKLPVVVNISYGPQQGPHDGSSVFERILELLIQLTAQTTPLTIVLAAGNSRQSRTHARFPIALGQAEEIGWRLQPEDLTPSFVEFWVTPAGLKPVKVSVTVTSPHGDRVVVSEDDTDQGFPLAAQPESQIFRAIYQPVTSSAGRTRVVVMVLATANSQPFSTDPVAPAGRWTVRIDNAGEEKVEVEGWISRDGPIGGRPAHGRQSCFDDEKYRRNDRDGRPYDFDKVRSYVTRERTLSGIATGPSPIVVGGFRRKPGFQPQLGDPRAPTPDMPATYSSMGEASGITPVRKGPTALGPSDDSLMCPGIIAAGTRSGSAVAMNGTSVAAPNLARYVADEIANGNTAMPPLPL